MGICEVRDGRRPPQHAPLRVPQCGSMQGHSEELTGYAIELAVDSSSRLSDHRADLGEAMLESAASQCKCGGNKLEDALAMVDLGSSKSGDGKDKRDMDKSELDSLKNSLKLAEASTEKQKKEIAQTEAKLAKKTEEISQDTSGRELAKDTKDVKKLKVDIDIMRKSLNKALDRIGQLRLKISAAEKELAAQKALVKAKKEYNRMLQIYKEKRDAVKGLLKKIEGKDTKKSERDAAEKAMRVASQEKSDAEKALKIAEKRAKSFGLEIEDVKKNEKEAAEKAKAKQKKKPSAQECDQICDKIKRAQENKDKAEAKRP